MRRQSGVAMIVVMVMVLIFLSMVLTVVMLSTSAVRRATAFQDRLIAFQVAEAGIQDALYWMNYGGYATGQYPCTGPNATYDGNYKYFHGSDYTGADSIWTNADPNTFTYTPAKEIPQGKCTLYFEDNTETDLDRIVSTGYYRGRTATITVNIRGANGEGNALHGTSWRLLRDMGYVNGGWTNGTATWGTAEAFNKHVVYANTATGSGANLYGNVAGNTVSGVSSTTGLYTKTSLPTGLFDVTRPDTSGCSLPTAPTLGTYDDVYSETGTRYSSDTPGGVQVNSISDGVYWDGNAYQFGTDNGSTAAAYARTSNSVHIYRFGSSGVYPEGRLRFGVNIGNYFRVDDGVTIDSAVFVNPNQTCIDVSNNSGIALVISTNARVSGDLVMKLGPSAQGFANSGWQIKGAMVTDRGFSISGTNVTIDASSSTRKAAILVYTAQNGMPFYLNPAATGFSVILGSAQNSALIFYAYGVATDATVNVAQNFSPTYASTNQAAIVAYSRDSTAAFNITAGTAVSINGLVYSMGTAGGSISLGATTGTINGALVANGTVTLGGGTVRYTSTGFKSSADVYKGFRGGRRVYLPVPGSWSFR